MLWIVWSVWWGDGRTFLSRFALALVIGASVVAVGVVVANREIDRQVAKIHRVRLRLAPSPPAGANYLIIGSDSRAGIADAEECQAFGCGLVAGQNSDTLMVAHIEPGARRALVVSFPRDLLVRVAGRTVKINSAYDTGGAQAVVDMLAENFGIRINNYLEVDFESFRQIVEAIGTVKVMFPYPTHDEETDLLMPAGCDPLDGDNALAYVRARYLDVAVTGTVAAFLNGPSRDIVAIDRDAPDLSRIQRQQAFLRSLVGLAINKSLGDPSLALDVANRVLRYLKADQTFNRDDVNTLLRAFRTVDVNDSRSVEFATIPTQANPADPLSSLLEIKSQAEPLIARLNTFGQSSRAPARVTPERIQLRLLDGTGTNLDVADALRELQAQGFVPAGTGISRRVAVSEVHYRASDLDQAKAMLDYLPDAKLVLDPAVPSNRLRVVLGATFTGFTVPPFPTPPGTVALTPSLGETPAPGPTTTAPLPRGLTRNPEPAPC
jgi:LCP family protein required for cell wall assembly